MAAGRPRTFCKNQALDRALEVFWRQGFEGASICDLTEAMGINPPSLYAAFGNKEQLFRQALDRYAEVHAERRTAMLAAPTAREAIKTLLREAARNLTDKSSPIGCLYVQAIAGAGEHAACLREMLKTKVEQGERQILERLERAKAEGELPQDADAEGLVRFISTVVQGMSVQAAAGASRKDLERVADMALGAWPA
ncbi:TetR family transcriptional regulator [Methyloceanibacter stevinii]|uniref:TetR family transcriptional regulator n=1 Tax=Methyloceanibacter stevinii TaxID=1774970 RepID=A0A1E3VUJ5_9HYPH|nr:TetR/AcrR family transcriptional regulator [Methyloceanibacter stevinii]ODR97218.1 TetR family transcriptional regulator [Methyloceanibacter stevinii]